MLLKKITLRNFKGIHSFEIIANGQSVSIFGDNATGKTTLADALSWILTDKDTQGKTPADFGIKTVDENGEVLHGLDHMVEAEFSEPKITLQKIYKEKWTRKRGSANEVFDGHTTDYFVNDVPVSATDYRAKVNDIVPEELLPILSLPFHFAESMHWKERRDILFELAGDIKTEDIIASGEDLEGYPELLNGESEDDRTKQLKGQRSKLNKELDNIPSRIDELTRLIEPVEDVDQAAERIKELQSKQETLQGKLNEVKTGGAVAEIRVQITELNSKLTELETAHKKQVEEGLSDTRGKIRELESTKDEIASELRTVTREYESKKASIEHSQEDLENLADRMEIERDSKPEEAQDICPVCERPMESDHNHEDYVAEFNTRKAEKIKELSGQIDALNEQIDQDLEILGEIKQKGLKVRARQNQLDEKLSKLQGELERTKSEAPDISDTEEYKKLAKEKADLQSRLEDHQGEKAKQVLQLQKLIEETQQLIDGHRKKIDQAEQNAKYRKRIEELNGERKQIAERLEQTEQDLYLIERFIRARSEYVTDKVNEKFTHVSWRLFKEQINGGLEECADPVYKGVPFSEGLNNAARIKAGLDIISTLSGHYGVQVPVVVDNAEAITVLPDLDMQLISLYVSEAHKELTVETKQQLQVA